MNQKGIKRISISMVRDIIENAKTEENNGFYIGTRYAMTKNLEENIKNAFFSGKPLRLAGLRIELIKRGSAKGTINLKERHLKTGTLVMLGNESIIQIQELSDDFDLSGIIIFSNSLKEILHGNIPAMLENEMSNIIIDLTQEEQALFTDMIGLLHNVSAINVSSQKMEDDIISAILHFVESMAAKKQDEDTNGITRDRDIFNRFIRLVNGCAGRERQIDYYADKLCLSKRYLGTVIKNVSGVTAKEWIDRATITEIKVLLKYSDMQIAEISDRLMFPNTSFFCKYFKRLTSLTPLEYKKR